MDTNLGESTNVLLLLRKKESHRLSRSEATINTQNLCESYVFVLTIHQNERIVRRERFCKCCKRGRVSERVHSATHTHTRNTKILAQLRIRRCKRAHIDLHEITFPLLMRVTSMLVRKWFGSVSITSPLTLVSSPIRNGMEFFSHREQKSCLRQQRKYVERFSITHDSLARTIHCSRSHILFESWMESYAVHYFVFEQEKYVVCFQVPIQFNGPISMVELGLSI